MVALKWVVEMENRYRKMAKIGCVILKVLTSAWPKRGARVNNCRRRVTGFDPDSGEAVFEEEIIEPENLLYHRRGRRDGRP